MNNALSSLINIIQDGIDMFTSSFGNISADDIKNVITQANTIVEGLDKNAKNVVKAVTKNVIEKTDETNVQTKKDNKTVTKNNNKIIAMPTANNVVEGSVDGNQ